VFHQFWGSGGPIAQSNWFEAWRAQVDSWRMGGLVWLLLLVGLPVLLALIVMAKVGTLFLGIPSFVLGLLLLLYAFGDKDFEEITQNYSDTVRRGETPLEESFDWSDEVFAGEPESRLMQVQAALYYQSFQSWFAVIFYFVVLGPAAAFSYRLLQLSRGGEEATLVERVLHVVDWVPSRLLSATFSFAGDFIGSRETLFTGLGDMSVTAKDFLYQVSRPALGGDLPPETMEFSRKAELETSVTRQFLSRCAFAWVAVMAIFVLFD